METTPTTNLYEAEIYVINLPELEARLDELARRAVKLGLTPPKLEITGYFDEQVELANGATTTRRRARVTVTGETPKLAGWTLLGVLSHESGTPFILPVPGQTVPREFWEATPDRCDHCQRAILRKETFILRHDDGRHNIVGRNCLRDFLGHIDPEVLLNRANYWWTLADDLGNTDWDDFDLGGSGPKVYFLEEYLTCVSLAIRYYGWLSKSAASALGDFGPAPTATVAWGILFDKRRILGRHEQVLAKVEAEDVQKAKQAIAWAAEIDPDTANEYYFNLRQLAISADGGFPFRLSGIAASMINAYHRHLEAEIKRQQLAAATANSQPVGQVKDKLAGIRATLLNVYTVEGYYGPLHIHKFLSAEGNVFVWKTTSVDLSDNRGESLLLSGTVKAHSEYKGEQQTELIRCKVKIVEE